VAETGCHSGGNHRGIGLRAFPAKRLPRGPASAASAGWNAATHGSNAKPDYNRLFSLDRVHELHITIAGDHFRAMQEDLRTVLPAFGRGGPRGGPPRGGGPGAAGDGGIPDIAAMMEAAATACANKKASDACTTNGPPGSARKRRLAVADSSA
jgi:hypothetical protein